MAAVVPHGRKASRVVQIWTVDSSDSRTFVGGLSQIDGMTNRDLMQMLQILLPCASLNSAVRCPSGVTLLEDDSQLQAGDYVVSGHDLQAGHKVVVFVETFHDLVGLTLDEQLLQDHRRPPDELLWWHFTQAVLANVRGAGEPIFEHDFPPGSDMMGQIREGPKAQQRLEFELFGRLARHVDIVGSEKARQKAEPLGHEQDD